MIFDIDYRPYSWPSAEIASDVLSKAGMSSDLIVGTMKNLALWPEIMARASIKRKS